MRAHTAAAIAALLCVAAVAKAEPDERHQFDIRTLTNRADLVSGGDALVEVAVPRNVPLHQVTLLLNGTDVTQSFVTDADARTMRGVLTGLREGQNSFVADSNGRGNGRPRAQLTITNHSIGGPVLSGPQITPFVCATPTPELDPATGATTNASGLSGRAAVGDTQCKIATEVKVWYRSTTAGCSLTLPDANTPPSNPCYKPYVSGTPADMAMTTTDAGLTVPFIVRVERGTINRGIYDIAVLYNPAEAWSALAPQAQWNGKVLYQFGASTGQPRRQFRSATNWTGGEAALARGYLIAQSSMTDSSLNSNRVSMAETVMMMKEHIGDTLGPIKFTIGTGCSGGSINSNTNASIAPGQLDGITISCAYPDSETTGMEVLDCMLLAEAYLKPQWLALMAGKSPAEINAKKAAINGHPDQTACHAWYNLFGSNGKVGTYVQRVVANDDGLIVPRGTLTNNCQLPNNMVYDPVTNPTGARCSAWDWAVSIWGHDGVRARETRDNAGIQYGLKALQAGAITAEEFVTVNEIIGGIDKDANFQAARAVADSRALETAYRAGIVMSGQHYANTAVIDMRGWDDSTLLAARPPAAPGATVFGIHYQWRSFGIRDRLDKEFGDHGNQVMWRFARNGLIPSAAMASDAFLAMDQWLTNLKADTSNTSPATKVRNARPASAFDFCLLTNDVAQSTKVTDPTQCDADPFLKPHSSPRQVAGGPRSEEILKCRTKAISAADYLPAVLSQAQLTRLAAVFPDGVCDWAAGGVGQQPALSPLDFSAGPGGVPLPLAPRAEPVEE